MLEPGRLVAGLVDQQDDRMITRCLSSFGTHARGGKDKVGRNPLAPARPVHMAIAEGASTMLVV